MSLEKMGSRNLGDWKHLIKIEWIIITTNGGSPEGKSRRQHYHIVIGIDEISSSGPYDIICVFLFYLLYGITNRIFFYTCNFSGSLQFSPSHWVQLLVNSNRSVNSVAAAVAFFIPTALFVAFLTKTGLWYQKNVHVVWRRDHQRCLGAHEACFELFFTHLGIRILLLVYTGRLVICAMTLNPLKPEFAIVIFSTTSRELLSQFSTCSGWRWFEMIWNFPSEILILVVGQLSLFSGM